MQSGWLQQNMKASPEVKAEATAAPETLDTAAEATGVSRRGFLQGSLISGAAAGLAMSGVIGTRDAHAGHAHPDAVAASSLAAQGGAWWPSRWGPADEAGASNWITPEKVLRTSRLIRTGQIYEMGQVYEAGMPFFGQRVFALRIPGTPSGGPFGDNKLIYHDEFVSAEIGQVGTQFDGLGHIGIQLGVAGDMNNMRYYNGWTETELANAYGLNALGMEKIKPIFTRGVLVDVAGYRGRTLDVGEEITVDDLMGALARQRINERSFSSGDAIFFHTGWSSLWMQDNARYNSGAPGIGMAVAEWIIQQELCVVGADTWPVEVVPNPDPNLAFVVHGELIAKNGILIHENLNFSELLAAGVSEFVYMMAPLRIKGGTGSPGRPIAIT